MALSSSRGSEEDGITTTRQVNGVFRDQLLSSYGRERRHTEGPSLMKRGGGQPRNA